MVFLRPRRSTVGRRGWTDEPQAGADKADTSVNLNQLVRVDVSMAKDRDLRATATGRAMSMRIFRGAEDGENLVSVGGPLGEALGHDTVQLRGVHFEPGIHLIEVKVVDGLPVVDASGQALPFTLAIAPTTEATSALTRVDGFIAGAEAKDTAGATAAWQQACDTWRTTLASLYDGASQKLFSDGYERIYSCGTPSALSGRAQLGSTTALGLPSVDLQRLQLATDGAPSGDEATEAASYAAWMSDCFVKMKDNTQLDRASGRFVAVSCLAPVTTFTPSISGQMKRWFAP
jgi:hypothetical protein